MAQVMFIDMDTIVIIESRLTWSRFHFLYYAPSCLQPLFLFRTKSSWYITSLGLPEVLSGGARVRKLGGLEEQVPSPPRGAAPQLEVLVYCLVPRLQRTTSREIRCAQTWAQKFDYCKMAENVFGDISENLNSESENSEVLRSTGWWYNYGRGILVLFDC